VRDLLVVGAVLISLPIALWRPFWGLLVFTWLAYMRPQDMAWTVQDDRFSLWVAGAMLLGLLLWVGRERLATLAPPTVLMILLFLWVTVTAQTALLPDFTKVTWSGFGKVVLVAVLTTGLVRTRERWRLLLLVTACSLGLLGLKYGVHGLLRGGARFDHGPGGFLHDNNDFALALNMALPLLVGIATVERQRALRIAAWGMAGCSLLTVVFTFSRGGLLTLAVVGLLLVLRARHRLRAVAVLGCAALVFFTYFASASFRSEYTERTQSISTYEEDSSAVGRLQAWTTSWRVFLDYPVTGVGPNNLRLVYQRYAPAGVTRVSHNTYLQLLAENGLPGFLLFAALIAATLLQQQRLTRRGEPEWVQVYARMLQISLLGFLVGATFLNRAFFDLVYHLIALTVCLGLAARAADGAVEETGGSAPADAALPWWKQADQAHRRPPVIDQAHRRPPVLRPAARGGA
jgi:probable O-glycosylation ligase (exosortase A-associated)